jgi:hypothetical protein
MSSKIEVSREKLESLIAKVYGEKPGNPDDELDELRALLAAPVVERQPRAWLYMNTNMGNELSFQRLDHFYRPYTNTGEHDYVKGVALYTAPPELAELQATIAQLTAENERLKGGQGEPAALTVWEGAMPESNGKSNFTVILHTGDLTEGICVYRSEYPDRARYEADCFRYLIGDPAFPEKPFICDYDADKHSGYVKPGTSQPAHVAVIVETVKDLSKGMTCLESGGGKYCIVTTFKDRDDAWASFTSLTACLDKVKDLNS